MKIVFTIGLCVLLVYGHGFSAEKDIHVEVMVSLVNVWVKVTDNSGAAVKHLSQSDFEIYEDGKKVEIDCAEEIDNEGLEESQQPKTPATGQKFVLYLDLLNTRSTDFLFLKPRLMEFLDQIALKQYQVMVVGLLSTGKLVVISPFTNQISAVKDIMNQAQGNAQLVNQAKDDENQIQTLLERLEVEDPPIMSIEDLAEGSRNMAVLRNTQTLRAAYTVAENTVSIERIRAEQTMASLQSLGMYLAQKAEDGHMVVVYLSGGFNTDPGRHYFELIERTAERRGLLFDRQVFEMRVGKQQSKQLDLQNLIRNTIGVLNRLNVTLYSIGARGLETASDVRIKEGSAAMDTFQSAGDFQGSLTQMAKETGGIAFVNSGNFKFGFDQLMADLRHYYLLCYYRPEHSSDRTFREIKVVCKKPGVTLRHRTGYFD